MEVGFVSYLRFALHQKENSLNIGGFCETSPAFMMEAPAERGACPHLLTWYFFQLHAILFCHIMVG